MVRVDSMLSALWRKNVAGSSTALHELDPTSPAYMHKLARAMILQGLGSGADWTEGQAALDLLRKAHQADPGNARLNSDLGRAINNYTNVQLKGDAAEEKVERFLEAAQFQDRALELEPTYAFAHYLRSILLSNARFQLLKLGRVDQALELVDQAISSSRNFVATNPAVPAGRTALAGLMGDRATILTRLGRLDEATESYEEAVRIYRELQAMQPREPRHVEGFVQTLTDLANLKTEAEQAEIHARITAEAEDAMRRNPTSDSLLSKFQMAYSSLGDKLQSIERLGEARKSYEDGIALFQQYSGETKGLSEESRARFRILACRPAGTAQRARGVFDHGRSRRTSVAARAAGQSRMGGVPG